VNKRALARTGQSFLGVLTMPKRWEDWMDMLLGIWLIISPFLLAYEGGYGGVSAWNSYVVGAVLVVATFSAIKKPMIWQEWVGLLLGLWLIFSPFILGFRAESAAAWNQGAIGLIIAIAAGFALRGAYQAAQDRYGGNR
jgi:hypothetical protein